MENYLLYLVCYLVLVHCKISFHLYDIEKISDDVETRKYFFNSNQIKKALNLTLGTKFNGESYLWDSFYTSQSLWTAYQMTQYQKIYQIQMSEAHVIIVPAINLQFLLLSRGLLLKLFPLIGKIPHVIVLKTTVCLYFKELANENAKLFHYISNSIVTCQNFDPISNGLNITISPYFWRTHYTGKNYYTESLNFKQDEIERKKTYLLSGCWKSREYGPRKSWMQSCLNNTNLCDWVQWDMDAKWLWSNSSNEDNNLNLAFRTISSMNHSWYTMLPTGDFCTRSVMYDVFQYDSIAIVPQHCKTTFPFLETINFDTFVMFISEDSKTMDIANYIIKIFDKKFVIKGIQDLRKVRHIFQFSRFPNWDTFLFDELSIISPFDDALTYTFKRVVYDLCKSNRLLECYDS